ncbi:ATP-binding protein [Phocaeicola sartorii]|uniref:ATP-binding protein n=2 Tax=Phocaeicola sartorii TaxID=671267 RepID=UPI0013638CA0|nr:ATP-binding protein [Phocaeicola sartorii]NBH68376.1 AAA family ATPase [Phocaeicola sartorii]
MEQQQLKRCPIGVQTFEKVIEGNYLYIDKTEYIYRMAHGASNYYFLSRPRRFGKSLLVSTLHSYFAGKKELFKGLAIEKLETEWTEYPVLHFDMSLAKHVDKETLESMLDVQLFEHEKIYGKPERAVTLNDRMKTLIMRACEQTGRQVVVLIDEYDAPLLDVMHEEEENLPVLRNVMRNFYSPLKACDPYLRFVFLTGITKFSQLSIFSELNNISNVSMDEPYAAICGITEEEMLERMSGHIECLAGALEMTCEETRLKLKEKYDGYHFTWPSPDIYNPFSLLNALERRKIDNYWFGSGTPTYLIEMLRKFHVLPSEVGHSMQAMASDFDAPTEKMESIVPLLYQSGYITIKDYDKLTELYTLDIPNREIRVGLMQSLLPNYLNRDTLRGKTTIGRMYGAIAHGDMDAALRLLQEFLSTIPYCDNTNYEGHYQQLFYIIFSLFGMYVDVEVRTPKGRVDVVMRTADTLYVIELKLGKDADAAMSQINLKNYPGRFALSGLPVVKVGVNFSAETHNIEKWVVEE